MLLVYPFFVFEQNIKYTSNMTKAFKIAIVPIMVIFLGTLHYLPAFAEDYGNNLISSYIDSLPALETGIFQGDLRKLIYLTNQEQNSVFCDGKATFIQKNKHEVTFLVSAGHLDTKPFECTLNGKLIYSVKVFEREFDTIYLNAPKTYASISAEDGIRLADEQKLLKEIYKQSKNVLARNWIFQGKTKTTSFGQKRIFQTGFISRHTGTDYRAPTGTPIESIGDGGVVLSKNLFYCGNTILIEHGFELFSMYCHLDKVSKKAGDVVRAGEIIGFSGSTGFSVGAHLHLGLRHKDNWIDVEKATRELINFNQGLVQ